MGTVPEPITMGVIGVIALIANAVCAALLYAYRDGDANMQSVWICSRNDVLGNLAVLLAALGVFGTGTGWPDLIVAAIMATLALQGAWIVVRRARGELQSPEARLAEQGIPS
jgi:Co/Zn/Cd efflux system component